MDLGYLLFRQSRILGRPSGGAAIRADGRIAAALALGYRIVLDPADRSLTPPLLKRGRWEMHLAYQLWRRLRPGDVAVDIGAHIGVHALYAAKRVGPAGLVAAIEPQAELCGLINESAALNGFAGRMRVLNLAIGAAPGEAQLGLQPALSGSASLLPNALATDQARVRVARLPDALAELGEPRFANLKRLTLKIDVEGYEPNVWAGMRDWLGAIADVAIFMEFSPVGYRSQNVDPAGFLAGFADAGFEILEMAKSGGLARFTRQRLAQLATGDAQADLMLRKGC